MSVNTLTLSCLLTALFLSAGTRSHAQVPQHTATQSLATIRRAAEDALRRELDPALAGVALSAVALDSRLRLPACGTALATQAMPPRGTQSRVLVRVACSTGATWNLNVPVEIRRKFDVLVMRRAVARGETLTAADVTVQSRTLPGLASPFVSSVAELPGRQTRRPIPEGAALAADALDVALLIKRGQTVTLSATTAGVEVRAPGLAMGNAMANQRVRVQNLYSLKIVEGVADNQGVVRVNP